MNFLDKFSKITQMPNFMKNPSRGSRVVLWEQRTDRQDETNCRFSQFFGHPYQVIHC